MEFFDLVKLQTEIFYIFLVFFKNSAYIVKTALATAKFRK